MQIPAIEKKGKSEAKGGGCTVHILTPFNASSTFVTVKLQTHVCKALLQTLTSTSA